MGSVIFFATCGTVCGKFLLGNVTDKLGGAFILKSCLGFNTLLLMGISLATKRWVFAFLWIVVSFIYGSAWGAVANVVRSSFNKKEWGEQLGLVAAYSRVGSFGSSFWFGWLLQRSAVTTVTQDSWRLVFQAAAGLQAVILAIYLQWGGNNGGSSVNVNELEAAGDPKSAFRETAGQLLRRVSRDGSFWAMALAKTCLLGVGQQIGFIPLYLVTGLGFDAGTASVVSGLFAVGSLFSSLVGAKAYKQMTPAHQVSVIGYMNVLNTIFPAVLALNALKVIPALSHTFVLTVLTLWGCTWALPFYLPPGIVALKIGGRDHAALITNLFDGLGFGLAAVYSIFAMKYGRVGNWAPVMIALMIFGGLSTISMHYAMTEDNRRSR